jgi:hypothetical protein
MNTLDICYLSMRHCRNSRFDNRLYAARNLSDGSCAPEATRPFYTIAQILNWADAHHQRSGSWPTARSGAIAEAPGETWLAVEMALTKGHRSLPGGSSLPRLLAAERGWTRRRRCHR